MTCEPFCDSCGGNLGHPAHRDWTCDKCKTERLAKGPKKRIRKHEFEPGNPEHFRLPTRRPGGGYRYYRVLACHEPRAYGGVR
jgi:hypothetical protein